MSRERGNQISVLHLLVQVPREGAPRHMAAGDVADAHLPLCAREGIQNRHGAVYPGARAYLLDGLVVLLRGDEGQQLVGGGRCVALCDALGGIVQGDYYRLGILGDGFVGNVLQRAVNHVGLLEVGEVSHAAAHAALEYEDVPLPRQAGAVGEISLEDGAQFLQRQIYWSSVQVCPYLEVVKGVLFHQFGFGAPVEERAEFLEKVVDSVLAPGARLALIGEGLEELRVLFIYKVFLFSEFPEVCEQVGAEVAQVCSPGVIFVGFSFVPQQEAQYQAAEHLVLLDSALGEVVHAQELVECGVEAVVASDPEVLVQGVGEPVRTYPPAQSLRDVLACKKLAQGRDGVVNLCPVQFFGALGCVENLQFAVPGFRENQEVGAGCLVHRPSVPQPDVNSRQLGRFASDKEIDSHNIKSTFFIHHSQYFPTNATERGLTTSKSSFFKK